MGTHEPAYDACNPIYRDGQPVEESAYLTDAFAREASDFIRRTKERPFFLYLSFNAVHSPLQAKTEDLAKWTRFEDVHRRIFAAMLASMDDAIGDVMETLRQQGLEKRTLVFFLSDNGGPTRELTSSNLPLRGEKGHMYEGGIRIPFMMQWKGVLPEGEVYRSPVSSMDIFPTSLAAAGEPDTRSRIRDGVNLLPYLLGQKEEAPHRTLYWRQGNRTALRSGEWKLVRNPPVSQAWELYHLAEDIGESEDLAEKEPEKMKELLRQWREYDAQMPTRYPMK
jgi:arylsulfatase B